MIRSICEFTKLLFWDKIVWFFEDLFSFESEPPKPKQQSKDDKIKQLENRVKVLESRGQIKSNEARTIRNCLDTPDIDMVAMCLGID